MCSPHLETILQPMEEDERRRWPRIAGRNPIHVLIVSAPEVPLLEGRRYYCWTEDFSVGGLRFHVQSPVPLNSMLKIDVNMQAGEAISFQHIGRVAWEQEFEGEGMPPRCLGVEIIKTLGGDESIRQWEQMVRGVMPFSSTLP